MPSICLWIIIINFIFKRNRSDRITTNIVYYGIKRDII